MRHHLLRETNMDRKKNYMKILELIKLDTLLKKHQPFFYGRH